jgi:hypothetical protein
MRIFPFSFLKRVLGANAPAFATGSDGALTVLNGETVDIPNGATRQYTTLDVQAGGTLRVLGGTSLTQIICQVSCNIDGQILHQGVENNGSSINTTTISGLPFVASITQRLGGRGGRGGASLSNNALGPNNWGLGTNGYGGGGGGGSAFEQSPGNITTGGVGGSNNGNGATGDFAANVANPNGTPGLGGTGNSTQGNGSTGQESSPISGFPQASGRGGNGGGSGGGGGASAVWEFCLKDCSVRAYRCGGGGGGGMKGLHGGYLYVFSTSEITGSGFIVNNGSNGFNGGNGGLGETNNSDTTSTSGGGGGGGAGGSGGHVIVETPASSVSVNVSGGNGGSGGIRGNVTNPANNSSLFGSNGVAGQTGLAGTYTFEVFP